MLKKAIKIYLFAVGTGLVLYTGPGLAMAQEGITLSVTPPLFELDIAPGESWSSSLKLSNPNDFTLTLYTTPVNFEATDDAGHGRFTPLTSNDLEGSGTSLASWLSLPNGPIDIPRGGSASIPFSVVIPRDAAPGGHYAAILVGTRPADTASSSPATIKVSSFVSSLLFVRIKGDIIERGDIREFSAERSRYDDPEVNFTLRFENSGNVHLRPEGIIVIENMWNKKRGEILVNQASNFGNVLPNTTRKFLFTWKGEDNFFEIGRYRAITTLSFGNDGHQNVTRTTSFWIVPLVPAIEIVGALALIGFFFFWVLRAYVRRAVRLEARYRGSHVGHHNGGPKTTLNLKTLAAPLRESALDLRALQNHPVSRRSSQTLLFLKFFKKYMLFFVFLLIVGMSIFMAVIYFREVFTSERDFTVEIHEPR